MFKWALVVLFGLYSGFAQAKAPDLKGFAIETTFEYQANGKTMKSESSFILDEKMKAWTTLTPPQQGVAVLGRVVSSDAKALRMEYIVVDTNQNNAVISTPSMHSLFGQKSQIEVGSDDGKAILTLKANPTIYSRQ